MRRPRMMSGATVITVAGVLAGCGAGPAGRPAQAGWVPAAQVPLATAVVGPVAGWAVVRMAGAGGQRDRFWQLLTGTAGTGRWRLATPPGVADNGGLAVAGTPGGTLTAGFVPSQLLTFTPLAISRDGGASWSPGLLSAALSAGPDALAALPDGRLLAITGRSAELSGPGGGSWTALTTLRSLAASQPGRACGLIRLTGAASGPGGEPMLAGDCARPGVAGIFAQTASGWRAAGPALPADLARQRVTVLRLASYPATGSSSPGAGNSAGMVALLAAGAGRAAALFSAWSAGHSSTWTTYGPFRLNGSQLESVSVGAGDQLGLVLTGRRGVMLGGPGQPDWRPLPELPAAAETLAAGPGRQITALAPGDSAVTVWQLTTGSGWRQIQVIGIPVFSGPSG